MVRYAPKHWTSNSTCGCVRHSPKPARDSPLLLEFDMSSDTSTLQHWEPLSLLERRILGVLVEKQKTSKSADSYPLSLNALTTGCNQKSNRDPVLDLSDDEVEEGLSVLQKKGLAVRRTRSRLH